MKSCMSGMNEVKGDEYIAGREIGDKEKEDKLLGS